MDKIIAKELLKIKAVFLNVEEPFTWSSGIKSPIYCDNRLTLSYPEVRDLIEEELAKVIEKHYPTAKRIMGTSTAGIAHAALVANILDLPMGYVRGSSKKHGRTNMIEGIVKSGEDVVVVEDLISTGGSVISVVEALRAEGCNVLGVVSIFTYNLQKGLDSLRENNVKNVSLSNYDTLLDVAISEKYIKENDKVKLLKFKENPSDSSWME